MVLLAFAFALALPTTTVATLDDAQLVARSDLVAHVVVTAAHAERVGRRVITFYDVAIVETWSTKEAGPGTSPGATGPGSTTLVALPGGVVDGIGQLVPGTPVLEVGGAYVLCLGDDVGPKGARGVVGLWQGAFALVDGERAGSAGRFRTFTHGGGPPVFDTVAALRARLRGVAARPVPR